MNIISLGPLLPKLVSLHNASYINNLKIFSNIKRDSILYKKKQVSTQPSMQTTLLHEGGTHIGNMLLQYTRGNENIVLQQFAMRTLYGMLLR